MKVRVGILVFFALTAVACSALKQAALEPIKVEGHAMEPALREGDRIFVNRRLDKLERGDIVILYYPFEPSKSYIKRIVGLPREAVEIREGKVLINGKSLDEPYVVPDNNRASFDRKEVKIPEESYYVLGDNRDNSSDSRIWGTLQRKFIYGKFVKKYYAAN